MSRKRAKIKPEQGERLKLVCQLEGISQKELSEMIFITQQTISKIIRGSSALTVPNAQKIAEVFHNKYRAEWLLGLTPYRTALEEKLTSVAEEVQRHNSILEALQVLAEASGYKITPPDRRVEDDYTLMKNVYQGFKYEKDGRSVYLYDYEEKEFEELLVNLVAVHLEHLILQKEQQPENQALRQKIGSYLAKEEESDHG